MLTIIDSDSIVYGACLSIKSQVDKGDIDGDDEFLLRCVKHQLRTMINRIIKETDCDEYLVVLSGHENFRYSIYPDYKANRKRLEKPPFFKEAREYLIKNHSAFVTKHQQEADDFCRIYMCQYDPDAIVSHIDKDLNMIVGKHHNFRTGETYEVTEQEAMHNFYTQMLTGDTVDNIPGLFKLTGAKATKKIKEGLLECETEQECWRYVEQVFYKAYGAKQDTEWEIFDRVVQSAQCLWLQTEKDEIWTPPL